MTSLTAAKNKFFEDTGLGTYVLAALALLGGVLVVVRFFTGLGPSTALSDGRGWGIWIGFDVVCGIALAAGAFTIAAVVYVFKMKQFYPILRPTVLTGFIGYALAGFSVIVDLGFPQRFWHMIFHWNIHSPLFEVAICVMTYCTILGLEISPILFERFNMKIPLRIIRSITIPLVVFGIILSTCHQSSLGTLFTLMPHRVHPLWYSEILPLMFLLSAIAGGLGMIIVESTLSSLGLDHELELDLLGKIASAIPFVIAIYLVVRFGDMIVARELHYLFEPGFLTVLFWIELIFGYILPMVLLSIPSVRMKKYSLFASGLLTISGLMLNRLSISLITFRGAPYWPSWQELFITIGLVSAGALVFTLASRYLPVFAPHEESHDAGQKDKASVGKLGESVLSP